MAQYKVETQALDPKISSHYEVMMLANNANGDIVTTTNPLPVKVMQTVSITNQGKLWFFQVARR